MDHHIPKRRVPVTYWCSERGEAHGQIFLDLDPTGGRHRTVLAWLNSPSRFIPVVTGPDGRIELVDRSRWRRLVPGPEVSQGDVFAHGVSPWREEDAEVWLTDGSSMVGRVRMPLERPTQRLSDFLNRLGSDWFVLRQGPVTQLVNGAAVTRVVPAPVDVVRLTSRGSRTSEDAILS
jgi:hypothetical protein